MISLKIKKLNDNAVIPQYAKEGDAGLDLTATSKVWNSELRTYTYGTGLALEIPQGYVGLLFPRSSIYKTPLTLANSVGVIDSGYRGEVKVNFKATTQAIFEYQEGDRIAQLIVMPYPKVEEIVVVDELSDTSRGEGGFGSTGK